VGAGAALRATERRAAIPVAPSSDELLNARTRGYQSPAVQALQIDPNGAERLVNQVQQNLRRDRFSRRQAEQTYDVMDTLRAPEFGASHTLQDFDSARQRLNTIAASPSTDGEAARRAIRSIDAYTLRVPQFDVIAGDARQAGRDLFEARANAAAQFRSQRIQDAIERATNTAGATHSGGNLENEIRKNLRTMLNNRKQMRGFNVEEREAIQAIVRGGPVSNIVRRVGKLLGGGGGLGQIASGSAGAAMFGAPGMFALPALGIAANRLGSSALMRRINALDEMVRARSPLYGPGNQAQRQAALSGGILQGLPTLPQAGLSSLIAARLQSPDYSRQ
jgi:hypothetical protein